MGRKRREDHQRELHTKLISSAVEDIDLRLPEAQGAAGDSELQPATAAVLNESQS